MSPSSHAMECDPRHDLKRSVVPRLAWGIAVGCVEPNRAVWLHCAPAQRHRRVTAVAHWFAGARQAARGPSEPAKPGLSQARGGATRCTSKDGLRSSSLCPASFEPPTPPHPSCEDLSLAVGSLARRHLSRPRVAANSFHRCVVGPRRASQERCALSVAGGLSSGATTPQNHSGRSPSRCPEGIPSFVHPSTFTRV